MIEIKVADSIYEFNYLSWYFQEQMEEAIRDGWVFRIQLVYKNQTKVFDSTKIKGGK